jgi:hypothetical protein
MRGFSRGLVLLAIAAALIGGCARHGRHASQDADAPMPALGAAQAPAAPPAASEPVNIASLAGTWQGSADGVSFQLIVQPNGAYSEIQTAGALMTQQSGIIQQTGSGVVTFVVQDWSPKTQGVYHPTGTVGGYDTQQPVGKPAGGTWQVQFNGPNAFSLKDVNLNGIIAFSRVD